jgi:hypothetical protein
MTDAQNAPAAEPEDSDIAWAELWEAQYALTRETGERVEKLTAGRSAAYRAALITYLIEYLAEQLRVSLRLPESDIKADGDA